MNKNTCKPYVHDEHIRNPSFLLNINLPRTHVKDDNIQYYTVL